MVKRAYNIYIDSFRGLRMEVWWLALITLINRAGTMVIPFLSVYMQEGLGMEKSKIGWIMTAFGLGSVTGAWFGGKLADRIGYYNIMFFSLILSGLLFILLGQITTFELFCAGIFIVTLVADAFRPAMFVALSAYSKPENRTRSVSLIRLAINLGFAMGPAAGGLIITGIGYSGLFWVDGMTCIGAAFLFIALLSRKEAQQNHDKTRLLATVKSPYKDGIYLLFLFIIMLIGFSFLQYFSTIPLYYKDIHELTEDKIGLLLASSGLIIFLLEMPIVKYLEQPQFSIYRIIFFSTLIFAASFLVLNLFDWSGILIVGIGLMSMGEILNFPFLNRFAMDRAEGGKTGEYMALFTIAFGFSQTFSHNAGMHLVEFYGYEFTWYVMTGVLVLAALLIGWLRVLKLKEEKANKF